VNELSSWGSALVLFFSQLALNWIRALNIQHITKRSIGKGLASTNVLAGFYLIATALGIRSVYELDPIPLIGYFLGCSLGYLLSLRRPGSEVKSV